MRVGVCQHKQAPAGQEKQAGRTASNATQNNVCLCVRDMRKTNTIKQTNQTRPVSLQSITYIKGSNEALPAMSA